MTGRTLLLVRYGRTAWNAVGRAQGHADAELDDLGHEQAAAVAPYLASLGPARLWSSDLSRARQTCAYVERATGLDAVVDARLRECDVGARQGMTSREFAEAFPEAYEAWRDGDELVRVPGSEVASQVATRIVPALREAFDALADGETGVVVTHGACLKVGLAGVLGWPLAQTVQMRGMGNCAWVTLAEARTGGGLRLAAYNQAVTPPRGHSLPRHAADRGSE